MTQSRYRDLPSVEALVEEMETVLPRRIAVLLARVTLDEAREEIANGGETSVGERAKVLGRRLERERGTKVINATGVLLHTNLGRAIWSEAALERARVVASGFSNMELDLETGERGLRGGYVQTLLGELTGAEASLVVNNNASALLLALAATAEDRSVPVARGELIEIGGSYRLPAVMGASGARMVEVGTTNRTRVGDYQVALQTHDCGALLKVHPSNYSMEGFTEEASLGELADLADDAGLPLIYDLGSGLLDSAVSWLPDWLRQEPAVRQSLDAGADVVLFSGDKLLGGPQAGLVVGAADVISRLRRNPLARALRVDAITYAALGATLEAYLDGPPIAIPFWRHALTPESELSARSLVVSELVGGAVERGASEVGAGSAPGFSITTPVIRITGAQDLFECLLDAETPVLARRDSGDLIIDLRAVEPEDDETVTATVLKCR